MHSSLNFIVFSLMLSHTLKRLLKDDVRRANLPRLL